MMTKQYPMQMSVRDGVLLYEDGSEVNLWGNNFQPNLYWEYKFRMAHLGIPMTLEVLQEMCDDGFRDLETMGCDVIRCHLTPSDFTDAHGNLVENMWLDLLGYTVSKARENGVYVYLTFVNHMDFTLIEDSFVAHATREEWIFDPSTVAATRNYIRQLLNWENPHTGIALKNDPVIAVWGLINEPEYLTYQQMSDDPAQQALFSQWLEKNDFPKNDVYYARYRYEVVRNYIDGMHRLLREEGAEQPVVWNCSWPRMIDGRRDVFRAIADSCCEAVSFCLYPGQDDVADPFVENPADMSDRNYLPFLKHCFDDYDHLGWLRDPQFASKARLVYEFETMYNAESSYLHPAMAKLFRALGVQIATMWTHTFNIYAPYQGGSHILNLKTTPKKAAGYIIAGEVFRHLPRGFEFSTASEVDDVFDGFALSWEQDLSIASLNDLYIHSGGVVWSPVAPPDNPKKIIGYGSSPFVRYEGRGLYFIDIGDESVQIEIYPYARFVRNWWEWHTDGKAVVELDAETAFPFELNLPGRDPIRFDARPGLYEIECPKLETLNCEL
jgi:hypothetical protein